VFVAGGGVGGVFVSVCMRARVHVRLRLNTRERGCKKIIIASIEELRAAYFEPSTFSRCLSATSPPLFGIYSTCRLKMRKNHR